MSPEQQTIRTLSDRLVAAQKPLRILDAIKWDDTIREDFFKHQGEKLPPVDKDYYWKQPLPFDVNEKIAEFRAIIRDVKNKLGQISTITRIMVRLCEEYCKAVQMLAARGTPLFSSLAAELYGEPDDVFYPGGPRLSSLGTLLGDILKNLSVELATQADEKIYPPEQAMKLLQARLVQYFPDQQSPLVQLSDNIIADASAGAECIKLNTSVNFSERDLRYLEVHEGWVHLGTTLNGVAQPYCTFLGKGSPASSITQEGLAVITEIFTFSSYPKRMLKITNRVKALNLVHQGANFIDTFRFFKNEGYDENDSYNYSVRIFRGSTPDGGPFTKDLSYAKGFILIYNYIRLAVQQGLSHQIPIFFVGKTLIEDIQTLADLVKEKLVIPPRYLPPQFKDMSALSAWMSFSLYLNKFDLETVAKHYKQILHD